ncbi:uncharacterized protein BP01DRAFT_387747 [Aspergillus saccharolyticus JOP 1030-1]|uniref:Uncharacterized protein n=1 Tax=Aspergillus saccharolyticus JOP 1030-1 TaxID=1450539 RepID=A0A318ZSB1_9EURO|nr:hypothetical protein BP01DRAFT_387747 [Aspergillus saccharolyticus JOP 1030-1]PYH49575.1 hypothetical protein BP01DRAFT_387747 [Aspergillus saccharolyticus JOP 1030-1]
MRDMPSRFIEILDPSDGYPRISDSDGSSKASMDKDRIERDNLSSPGQRWKRLSNILVPNRRAST